MTFTKVTRQLIWVNTYKGRLVAWNLSSFVQSQWMKPAIKVRWGSNPPATHGAQVVSTWLFRPTLIIGNVCRRSNCSTESSLIYSESVLLLLLLKKTSEWLGETSWASYCRVVSYKRVSSVTCHTVMPVWLIVASLSVSIVGSCCMHVKQRIH